MLEIDFVVNSVSGIFENKYICVTCKLHMRHL